MDRFQRAFFAYPAQPNVLTSTIEKASDAVKSSKLDLIRWPEIEVFGAGIADIVRQNILQADVVICDITLPNLNVYYEAGFAIGAGKPIAPVINTSFAGAEKALTEDGLFDVIGYSRYENSDELRQHLLNLPTHVLISLYERPINYQQPLYILDTVRKTDFRNAIVSTVKESGVFFRSFDPVEIPRFSTISAIGEVTSSAGVIVPLLGAQVEDADRHNRRAAMLIGIAHGVGRNSLLLQREYEAVPLDYREYVVSIRSEDEIGEKVTEFSKTAHLAAQSISSSRPKGRKTALQSLNLGASSAENEFRTLENYFVQTAEFRRALRGEARIVAGRKGSGKTAIFFQVRDEFRRRPHNLIIDLKPESHQLSLFREELVKLADVGLFDHTLAAFWYYVALTEVLLAMRKSLGYRGVRNTRAAEALRDVADLVDRFEIADSGDFTTRINRLGKLIVAEITRMKNRKEHLTAPVLTNIIFKHGVTELRELIHKYASDPILLLFDNIDKGWLANGVHEFDVRLVRLLVEALDKVKRDLHADGVEFTSIVFLRNDIYELLMDQTPDRGKAGQVRIDWTDRAKLRQVIYARLAANLDSPPADFETLWAKYFTEKVNDQASFEYCLDHCLMRPRFLINIVETAISNAINRGHVLVQENDFIDSVRQHSLYLVNDFGYEIRDVSGLPQDILYSLVGVTELLTRDEVTDRFAEFGVAANDTKRAFELMLWYGVLGVAVDDHIKRYIYDFDYDMRRLSAEITTRGLDVLYVANPALHVGLRHH